MLSAHCLLTASDQLILMVQRRVVDLWRHCAEGVHSPVDWAARYRQLLADLARLSAEDAVPDAELRSRLTELVGTEHSQSRPSRASLIRQRLIDATRPVRALLQAIVHLPWQVSGRHPVTAALDHLRALYAAGERTLPVDPSSKVSGASGPPSSAAAIASGPCGPWKSPPYLLGAEQFGMARCGSSIR